MPAQESTTSSLTTTEFPVDDVASSTKTDPKNKSDRDAFNRWALFTLASLYTFFFVGAPFGWGPMQRMLESAGAFLYQCAGDAADTLDDGGCSAQGQTLINIGFMASTLSVVTPLMGSAIDHYGAPTVSYFMCLCGLFGSGLVVIAAVMGTSWIYWIAFGLLGLETFTGSLLSVQVGLFFQGVKQVRIIMWLNSLFDAGSVSYLFLWAVQESFDWTFLQVAMAYFGLSLVLFVPSAYFWTLAVPEEKSAGDTETAPLQEASEAKDDESESTISVSQSLRFYQQSHVVMSLQYSVSNRDAFPDHIYGSIDENADENHVLVADRSPKEQLLSLPYVMLVFFFAVSQMSCNWSLITAADFLASLGDQGFYLKVFTLMQPVSVLALPLVDSVVQRYGFGAAFQAVNGINFVYILIKCTSTNLHLQVFTFLCVAVVRCFLYACVFSFLPQLLSAEVVGRGTGFLAMVGGLASFLNIPLNALTIGGDFFIPNLIYLCAIVPCTGAAWHVNYVINLENKIKAANQ